MTIMTTGYLVVTNPIGKGIFKAPSDGQLLACKMADDSTLDAVRPRMFLFSP